MTAPLRDAVADKLREVNDRQQVRDLPDAAAFNVLAENVLTVVADYIEASVLTSTDARKRTILNGLAARIARGAA